MTITVYLRNGQSFTTDWPASTLADLLTHAERREQRSAYGANTADGYVPFFAADVGRIEVDL